MNACLTCKWREHFKGDSVQRFVHDGYGNVATEITKTLPINICRRRSPICVDKTCGSTYLQWPNVKDSDWCGDWEASKE